MLITIGLAGCATPEYAVRGTPTPDESTSAIQIERTISAVQAKEFEHQGSHPVGSEEILGGLPVQQIVTRLSRVTERSWLHYRAYLYRSNDPNAAALADGRVFISTGMINYLAHRGGRADELAFVLGHELGHTVAQHLVKRYRMLQQEQFFMGLVSAGASAIAQNASAGVQEASKLALDAASLLQNVHDSGYSQEQELEADQLGIRYVIRAGFDPLTSLDLLQDFQRFDSPSPFLRTHPYMAIRREYLQRYLSETGQLHGARSQPSTRATPPMRSPSVDAGEDAAREARTRQLREIQKLYPEGSISWQNLQRQIDALDQHSR